jgi:hypothetical protein
MKETAEILGCSYATVHRLLKRGLLKSSSALRCKIISKRNREVSGEDKSVIVLTNTTFAMSGEARVAKCASCS